MITKYKSPLDEIKQRFKPVKEAPPLSQRDKDGGKKALKDLKNFKEKI